MNNELEQEQKDLELEIMELEDKLGYKKEQLERLRHINTNGRYFLDGSGCVNELIPTVNHIAWAKAIRQGNTFKTVEDAEKERDRRALLYEFNQFRDERNNGWEPNWNDSTEWKTCIYFGIERELKTISTQTMREFVTFGYFRNVEDCLDAIEKFGDRIKKLYID